jgi:hypothetical protein
MIAAVTVYNFGVRAEVNCSELSEVLYGVCGELHLMACPLFCGGSKWLKIRIVIER